MKPEKVMLITGTSRGIGKYLAEHYCRQGFQVIGCSRQESGLSLKNYEHVSLDVTDEGNVKELFRHIREKYKGLDVLINNAGVASMNHVLLTPVESAEKVLAVNMIGTFLFSREAAKIMKKEQQGRIVNFTSVAVPLKIEGEAIYASAKAAVISFTQILARELAIYGITVNAVGPAPVRTDLLRSVPEKKIHDLIQRQAIKRWGEFRDISNVIDFFISPDSDFVTGQVLFLGGV